LEQLENTKFTTKPNVMSTLEQLLEMGREEGLEKGMKKGLDKGVYKKSIFNLLKTALRFPDWPAQELADFAELPQETVQELLDIAAEGDSDKLLEHVQEGLLADIPLSAEEAEKLQGLVEQLAADPKR
jgi:flagellar biosynthesis/type III secretory pathway protein FliH